MTDATIDAPIDEPPVPDTPLPRVRQYGVPMLVRRTLVERCTVIVEASSEANARALARSDSTVAVLPGTVLSNVAVIGEPDPDNRPYTIDNLTAEDTEICQSHSPAKRAGSISATQNNANARPNAREDSTHAP